MADRLLSSSTAGYLVIPKLQDGKYELGIGFPKNEWPLQKITLSVRNDAGYILKNFDSKGWGLFNMQTMDIVMSSSITTSKDSLAGTKTDGFADVLADVVSTPSIKQKPVVENDIRQVIEPPVIIAASEEIIKKEARVGEEKSSVDPVLAPVKLSSVIESNGRFYIYIDKNENTTDTIRFFIPDNDVIEAKEKKENLKMPVEKINKTETKPESNTDVVAGNNSTVITQVNEQKETGNKTDTVVLTRNPAEYNISGNEKKESTNISKENTEPKPENNFSIMTNSDCKINATGDDFLKLRKKMAAETSDDDMITVAKKAFKTKCFSTEQVGNLSVLFLKDEGRYNFFDAAYPRVFDTHNFSGLINKLTEEYYISRFKAMIRH